MVAKFSFALSLVSMMIGIGVSWCMFADDYVICHAITSNTDVYTLMAYAT